LNTSSAYITDEGYLRLGATGGSTSKLHIYSKLDGVNPIDIIGVGNKVFSIDASTNIYTEGSLNVSGNTYIGGTLDLNSNKIINLADGTDSQDAVTKSQLDAVEGSISDTWWGLNEGYIYNNSNSLDFNETLLNTTIDSRVDGAVTDVWVNTSGDTMSGNLNMGDQDILTVDTITFTSNQIELGDSLSNSGTNSITIGKTVTSSNYASIGIGTNVVSSDFYSLAIGLNAEATGMSSIALGGSQANRVRKASAAEDFTIAIGMDTSASAINSIVIGNGYATGIITGDIGGAWSAGNHSISIGTGAGTEYENSVAIGKQAYTEYPNSIAIGRSASTYGGSNGLAIGDMAYVDGEYGIAIGSYSEAYANSVAIGQSTYTYGNHSFTIGSNVQNDYNNTFMVGGDINHTFLNTTLEVGGNIDLNSNKITNLANGTDGQDAVTLSQLQAINSSIETDTNTWWNITGSNYLINSTNILELNETTLNTTIDARAVDIDGDTMSGNLSMGGNYIQNLANGTDGQDAVTKSQLDAVSGSIETDTDTWWNITGSNYLINSSNILEINETTLNATFVPYTGATTDVDLDIYDLTANNLYADNHITAVGTLTGSSLLISTTGEPSIIFKNTAQTVDTGVDLIGQGTSYQTGKIGMKQIGSWTGADVRNYNSYMTFSTLIDKVVTENMRITNDGNVGIGTTDPQHLLDVDGTIYSGTEIISYYFQSTNSDATTDGWIGMTYDVDSADGGTYFGMQHNAGGHNIMDFYGNSYDGSPFNISESITYEYGLGTDGTDGNFKIGVGYALDGAFDRNDFVMNRDGDIYMDKNVTIGGILNLTSGKITNLANGTDSQDAVTLSQLQAINSSIETDTNTWWNITGSQYLENRSGVLDVNETTLNATITSLVSTSVTDVWVNESGDTMTGDLNMGANQITNINQLTFNSEKILVGTNAIASGSDSIAIGKDGSATGEYSIILGGSTFATGLDSLAILFGANASANGTISIGSWSMASGLYSISLGGAYNIQGAVASGDYSIAIGGGLDYGAIASGTNSIAIGQGTNVSATNAIALGANTQNAVANSFKVGGSITDTYLDTNLTVLGILNMTSGKITNLANGTDGQDAVTLSQLQSVNNSIQQDTNTWWNITGSNYLINSSNILELNETKLNATFVPYTSATNNLDLNNKNLTSVSYVGIGTATPNANLQVNGTFNATNNGGSITLDSNGDVRIGI
jgi:trimeric autotransporter adhesin